MAGRLGLRGKSLLALLIACLFALAPAAILGWQAVEAVREHFGLAYVRNYTDLNRQKILAPVSRELALAQRFADSGTVRQWLLDKANPEKRALFFKEAEGYRHDFRDHSWFLADGVTRDIWYGDDKTKLDAKASYRLNPQEPHDSWFFATLRNAEMFNINPDFNHKLNVTKVWINVIVGDGDRRIGVAGSGLDLTGFLRDFILASQTGVTSMLLNGKGVIQAHPDPRLIELNSGADAAGNARTLFDLLGDEASRDALKGAMAEAEKTPEQVATAWISLDGKRQLAAVGYIPELHWHVLTAVDLEAAKIIQSGWLQPAAIAFILVLALLLAGFVYAVERLLLKPLRRLHQSARAIAGGDYDLVLPEAGRDEIGDLSRAFGVMADKVKRHTMELEGRVQERTSALEGANRAMAAAHKQIDDSIVYASLIQRAILPDREMVQSLGPNHFVLWRPRDVVGGDFYVFRQDGENCLLGVVDCAGHGVPGALMTMLARAAIDHAVHAVGARSPSAILAHAEAAWRSMLSDSQLPRAIATNMDAGLVYIDRTAGRLRFAGAKISLYWSDGGEGGEIKGGRHALGHRRRVAEDDQEIVLQPDRTYYLATDGFLDQAGGEHGFGLGTGRFAAMLRENAHLPPAEQGDALAAALARYQGQWPQRDDITMLSFRFGRSGGSFGQAAGEHDGS